MLNSNPTPAKPSIGTQELRTMLSVNDHVLHLPVHRWQGCFPSHLVRELLHWSQALLARLAGVDFLALIVDCKYVASPSPLGGCSGKMTPVEFMLDICCLKCLGSFEYQESDAGKTPHKRFFFPQLNVRLLHFSKVIRSHNTPPPYFLICKAIITY